MVTNSFREFLKKKSKETGIPDLGEAVIIFGNIPGTIVGFQNKDRWVSPDIKGMQTQLVNPKDIVFDDQDLREKTFKEWLKNQKE